MTSVQEVISARRFDDAFNVLAAQQSLRLAESPRNRDDLANILNLLDSVGSDSASLLGILKHVEGLAVQLGVDFTLYLFERVLREWVCKGRSAEFDSYAVVHDACEKLDRFDVLERILRSRLIFEPAKAQIYFYLLQAEVKLGRAVVAARLLQRSACIEPRIYAMRQAIGVQGQIFEMAKRLVEDRVRKGLCTAVARQTGGVETVELMARNLRQAGSDEVNLRGLDEALRLALAIGRPDLARDVLQQHRTGAMGRMRRFWGLVKRLQRSGVALAEGFYPFSIHLESVNACNAACVMCPVSSTARRRKRMSPDLVDKVIEEILTYPFKPTVGLHGVGEPLLHKDLVSRVAKFTKAGIHVYFSTNGQLMTERKATELLEAGLPRIIFSLETLDAAVYEAIRVGLSFDVVLNNIKSFLKLRDRLGAKTSVQVTLVRAPDAEERILTDITTIRSMLSPTDQLHLMPRHNFTGGYAEGEAEDLPCTHPFLQLNMTSDGLVTACCLDSEQVFVAGDFNSQSMLEIYNSPAFQELRRKHEEGRRREVDICRDCTGPETWVRQAMLGGTAAP